MNWIHVEQLDLSVEVHILLRNLLGEHMNLDSCGAI